MMRRILFLALVTGCASTSATAAFHDTAVLVESRTGKRIAWNQGGADDEAVAARIRTLTARELTANDAIAITLLGNRELQATYEDLSVAQADLVQAGLLHNPVLGGSVAVPFSSAGGVNVSTGFAVSIAQDFIELFMLSARKKIASAELESVKLRVANGVLRATSATLHAYFMLVSAQQTLSMRRTIADAADAATAIAKSQFDAGNINELDFAQQSVQGEQVHVDIARSEADVVTAREALTRFMGLWGDDANFTVPNKLPDLPASEVSLEHLEKLAIGRRLDLASAHAHSQAASQAAAMAKNFRMTPAVGIGATLERSPEHYSTIGPSASLELPLFDQHQAQVARLEAEARRAKDKESALAVDVRSEVRSARERLRIARSVVERYAKVVVPLREQVVTLSQEQYNAMLLGAYPLLAAKQNEVNAYRELIEALRDYWIARVDLEQATGGSLQGGSP